MIKIYRLTRTDWSYYVDDRARELEGLRSGPAGRWLRGSGPLDQRTLSLLGETSTRTATTGYDIIVAAPRPLSVLLAIDPVAAPMVIAAHQAAVAVAIEYLDRRAVVVRTRRGDEEYIDAGQWGRRAAFTHGVNRLGEPHLHDHVIVGARPVGETSLLDGQSLRAHALSADALYRSTLRQYVGQQTRWQPWRSFTGLEHVADIDEGYRALWGGRSQERPAKRHWLREEIVAKWSEDLAHYVPLAVLPTPKWSPGEVSRHRFAGALEGRRAMYRHDIVTAYCNAAPVGVVPEAVDTVVNATYPELIDCRGLQGPTLSPKRALAILPALEQSREYRPQPQRMVVLGVEPTLRS